VWKEDSKNFRSLMVCLVVERKWEERKRWEKVWKKGDVRNRVNLVYCLI
jgi:hypothetical protein